MSDRDYKLISEVLICECLRRYIKICDEQELCPKCLPNNKWMEYRSTLIIQKFNEENTKKTKNIHLYDKG